MLLMLVYSTQLGFKNELEYNIMNVHRIQELRQPDSERRLDGNNQRQQVQQNGFAPWDGFSLPINHQNIKYAEKNRVLFISGARQVKPPREQNFWDMMVYAFCPTWNCFSTTLLILLVDTVMLVGEAIYGINKNGELLQISIDSLIKFGATNGKLVRQGQIYRLLSAIFVHSSFSHYIGNIFSTFILISRIQHTFGHVPTLVLYLICGIGGNIFSLMFDVGGYYSVYKAGASTALYGSMGIVLGYLIINWSGLKAVGDQMRCNIVCVFLFLFVFVIIFTPSTQSVDFYGHFGGFLTGIWVTGFLQSLIFETRQKIITRVFIGLFLLQLISAFVVFYVSYS